MMKEEHINDYQFRKKKESHEGEEIAGTETTGFYSTSNDFLTSSVSKMGNVVSIKQGGMFSSTHFKSSS